MIRSKLLLCADRAIRDTDGGNLSIINILDDITAESFPVLIHRFSVINFLIKETAEDPDKPSIRLKVYNNDKIVGDHQLKIDFRGKLKTRSIIQLGGVPLTEPGQAHFIITDNDGNEMDRYTINLHLRQAVVIQGE